MPARILLRLLALAAATGLAFAGKANAQQSGLFGSNSPLNGSNGLGTASTGGLGSFGNSGGSSFGNTGGGFGSTGGGFGNTGAGGFGSTGGGFGTTGGNTGFGNNNQFGAGGFGNNNGQQGFIGRSNTQGAMIGNRQAGQQGQGGRNQFGNQGQFGRNNQNQFNRGGQNRNFMQQQQGMLEGGQGQPGQQQRSIRPQLRVAFELPAPRTETSLRGLEVRFERISKRAALSGVTMDVSGSTVTLRGQVASEDARKLAGMLVALEPGVRSVKNELTVAAQPPPSGLN